MPHWLGNANYKTYISTGGRFCQEINAYKSGHIVYLAHTAVWYTAEGGVTALDLMLADLESALL